MFEDGSSRTNNSLAISWVCDLPVAQWLRVTERDSRGRLPLSGHRAVSQLKFIEDSLGTLSLNGDEPVLLASLGFKIVGTGVIR